MQTHRSKSLLNTNKSTEYFNEFSATNREKRKSIFFAVFMSKNKNF